MKIVYIDDSVSGHHKEYLMGLAGSKTNSCVAILPEKIDRFPGKQYICVPQHHQGRRTFAGYQKWLQDVYHIVERENPDVVHFLYGDAFYKYFGFGLSRFQKYHSVVTVHWVRPGRLQRFSLKCIAGKVNRLVLHSEFMKREAEALGIRNVRHIEYPQFRTDLQMDRKTACSCWGLDDQIPVIACVGNTRPDKGLDILLEALNGVSVPFQLLIAGKAEAFDAAYIKSHTQRYADRVFTCLKYLTDEELRNAVNAASIIALPYKKSFNGASGPLVEGVWCGKCIVGSDHGNLGDTIEKHHLGYTFERENPEKLAQVLEKVLTHPFVPDDVYKSYQQGLNPQSFQIKYEELYKNVLHGAETGN